MQPLIPPPPPSPPVPTGRAYAGKSAAERQSERRERLMAAGQMLFATLGLEATTMREVSARARVRLDQAQELFGSKTGLFIEVHKALSAELHDAMVASLPPDTRPDLRRLVRTLIVTGLEHLRADPAKARILVGETSQLQWHATAHLQTYLEQAAVLLRARCAERFPRASGAVDIEVTLAGLLGYIVSAGRCWMNRGFDLSAQELADQCLLPILGLLMWLEAKEVSAAA